MKSVILIFCVVGAGLLKRTYSSAEAPSPNVVFNSCTACPKDIRGFLNIPLDVPCDMVRWKLEVEHDGGYILNATWGHYVDNRTFKDDGTFANSRGTWKVSNKNPGFTKSEIYVFASTDRPKEFLSLLKLNDNMFQIMSKAGKILRGDEGYANMLTRVDPVSDKTIDFVLTDQTVIKKDLLLVGRTPLHPFDKELPIVNKEDQQKIKWKIKLYADGRLEVREILEHIYDWKGTWTVENTNGLVIYKLNFDGKKLSLLKGSDSDDLFFFISQEGGLMSGGKEFGSALTIRPPSGQ